MAGTTSSCGCASSGDGNASGRRRPTSPTGAAGTLGPAAAWAGPAVIGAACVLACAASLLTPLLWLPAAIVAAFGGYRTVAARGCIPLADTGGSERARRLDGRARRRRLRTGLMLTAAGSVLTAVAICDLALVWPLAALALWLGTSFLTAAATGYPGCPELGAIASLLLGRNVATRCPPLERTEDSSGSA